VVALDQGAREFALAPDELEAVPLERALARAALAERLTLDHQRPDLRAEALDRVFVHDGLRREVFAVRLRVPAPAQEQSRPRLTVARGS
jgi:hypothetical protein